MLCDTLDEGVDKTGRMRQMGKGR